MWPKANIKMRPLTLKKGKIKVKFYKNKLKYFLAKEI